MSVQRLRRRAGARAGHAKRLPQQPPIGIVEAGVGIPTESITLDAGPPVQFPTATVTVTFTPPAQPSATSDPSAITFPPIGVAAPLPPPPSDSIFSTAPALPQPSASQLSIDTLVGPSPTVVPGSFGSGLHSNGAPSSVAAGAGDSGSGPTSGAANAEATPEPTATKKSSDGVSGGAVVGVVIVVVLILLGVTVFLVRRRFLAKRKLQRITWEVGQWRRPFDRDADRDPMSLAEKSEGTQKLSTKLPSRDTMTPAPPGRVPPPPVPPTPVTAPVPPTPASAVPPTPAPPPAPPLVVVPVPPAPSPAPAPTAIAAPPPTFNNPGLPAGIPPALTPGGYRAPPLAAVLARNAMVQCTFVPNLPDELSITTGEIVSVLSEYDDGWASCLNTRGEKGMVPLECLDYGGSGIPQAVLDPGAARASRRASSLYGGQ